jgi:hypothetical protein
MKNLLTARAKEKFHFSFLLFSAHPFLKEYNGIRNEIFCKVESLHGEGWSNFSRCKLNFRLLAKERVMIFCQLFLAAV